MSRPFTTFYAPDEVAGAWERVAKNGGVAHVDMLGMSQLTLLNPKLAWSVVSDIDQAHRGEGGSVSKVAENCERLAKDGSRNPESEKQTSPTLQTRRFWTAEYRDRPRQAADVFAY